MPFRVQGRTQSFDGAIDVSEDTYNSLRRARLGLLQVLLIEEKFDMIIENYFEFESEILSSSLRWLATANRASFAAADMRLAITRRLANLLTTCRIYLDQSSHDLSKVFGPDSPIEQAHTETKSSEYDQYLSYRILEALRNYSQHRGYPFHIIAFSTRLDEQNSESGRGTVISPKLSIDELQVDGGFKSDVLAEIEDLGQPSIDLKPHVRQYIDSLYAIHSSLRTTLSQHVETWTNELSEAYAQLAPDDEDHVFGFPISIVETAPTGEEIDVAYFSPTLVERRELYEAKNTLRRPLASAYVSSQV